MNMYEQVLGIVALSASAAVLIVAILGVTIMICISIYDMWKNRKDD